VMKGEMLPAGRVWVGCPLDSSPVEERVEERASVRARVLVA
jgi:hypothetical protein